MARVVERVVSQRTQGEGVLVRIPGVADQRLDEVAGTDVVREVGEQMTAERVVAEVLNQRAAVCVGASLVQLFRAETAIALTQQPGDLLVPTCIDGTQMRDDRICLEPRRRQQRCGDCERTQHCPPAPTIAASDRPRHDAFDSRVNPAARMRPAS